MDTHDNTALHYAASGLNTAIAAKLLRHTIDMEAKNKVEVYLLCEKIFSEIKCVNQVFSNAHYILGSISLMQVS